MSKLSPTEARNVLIAAGFLSPNGKVAKHITGNKKDPKASQKAAIEQRKATFKQAEQKKGGE
jgi:hypothetical protein